ncbi:unnamed protein product [Linum trigynum]|uniref:C2H2-type domain-containing protein n=1 Tax=Linum trigynum TaxID=586398 RepID=A0AAV2FEI4_9ROSI
MAKQGSSDSSSDDAVFAAPRAATAAKRSYECSFCKRGFTNAQALGGHMNIHRRDRATKSSKLPSASAAMIIHHHDPIPAFSTGNYYFPSPWEAHQQQQQRHVFFQQPPGRGPYGNNIIRSNYNIGPRSSSSSSHVEAALGYNNLVVPPAPPRFGSAEEVLWGANLSLQVGSGQNQQERDDGEEEEEEALGKRPIWNGSISSGSDDEQLDLELRLGH